jgi:hypothetical protein
MPLPFLLEQVEPLVSLVPETTEEASGAEPPGGARPPSHGSLPFTMQPQEQTNWCWAAVAASVAIHYDPAGSWRQCSLADAELGQTTCCNDGACAVCNVEWRLSRALTRTSNLRGMEPRAMTFAELRADVTVQRPMCARIEWQGGTGHFVVLVGYADLDGTRYITVEDPAAGQSVYDFEQFLSAYEGSGRCTHAYWTRKA